MGKRITATVYLECKVSWKRHGFVVERDPQGYLFSEGKYRTKILSTDMPEWYVYGYMYKRHGYMSAKGIKHLIYKPDYFVENHLHKYDTLYVSYDLEITPDESDSSGFIWYKGYDHAIGGPLIPAFVDAAGKYSEYDVGEIRREIEKKTAWYCERNQKP
jgi:hypothetical protein